MLKKADIRRIEVAREKLNHAMGSYEESQDKEDFIYLSEKLDQLIVEYMQITK